MYDLYFRIKEGSQWDGEPTNLQGLTVDVLDYLGVSESGCDWVVRTHADADLVAQNMRVGTERIAEWTHEEKLGKEVNHGKYVVAVPLYWLELVGEKPRHPIILAMRFSPVQIDEQIMTDVQTIFVDCNGSLHHIRSTMSKLVASHLYQSMYLSSEFHLSFGELGDKERYLWF